MGADDVVDYATEDLVTRVKELTDGRGADVIYDPIGGDVFDASRRLVAFEGRILVIGFVAGRFAEAPTNHVLIKNYAVVGVHWALYRRVAPEWIPRWQGRLNDLWAAGRDRSAGRGGAAAARGPRGVAASRVAGNDREGRAGALGGQSGEQFRTAPAAQYHLPHPSGVEPHPGELPAAVLRLDREPDGRGHPRHVTREPDGVVLPFPDGPLPTIPFDCVSLDRAGLAATRHRLTSER